MTEHPDGPFGRLVARLDHLLRLDGGSRVVSGSDRPLLSLALFDYYVILVVTVLLAGIGALMSLSSSSVYAQSQDLSPYYYAIRQVIFLLVGGGLAALATRISERLTRVLGLIAYIGTLVMLLLVFSPLGSDAGKGNRNWLTLGPVTLQPSEFAKLSLVIVGSSYLAARREDLGQLKHLLPYLVIYAVPVILIIAQGDLGTVTIIAAIMFAQMWAFGIRLRHLLALLVVAAAGVSVAVMTQPSRMRRVMLFLHPTDSPEASQQPLSAIFALASGGWWGVGIGASRQKWGGLYDGAQNDYVFAVLGEEMGLVGTIAVIVLFTLLAWVGIRVAMRSESQFSRVLAVSISAWTAIQAIMNMGVALDLFPVFGVPLPFISIGGSALISNLVAAGLLMSCARREKAARRYLDASRRSGAPRVTTVVDGGRHG